MIDYFNRNTVMSSVVITTEDITDIPAGTLGKVLWITLSHASIDFSPFGSRVVEIEKLRYANGLDIVMDVATSKR